MAISSNKLVREGVDRLKAALPRDWRVTDSRRPKQSGGFQPDAVLSLRAPDGASAEILIEAKQRLSAQVAADLAPRLSDAAVRGKTAGALVVAPFLSPMTRERLRAVGVNYLDLTGNARIALARPAVLIQSQGAEQDPDPPERGIRSLKGGKAGRIVRALCDWLPPFGIRTLAARAGTDPGYTSRVVALLEGESVIDRQGRGEIAEVRWQDLLRRWSQDYRVTETNKAGPFLAPRGVESLIEALRSTNTRYAVTGSFAVPETTSIAPSRLLSIYVDDAERFASKLKLRGAATGANVLLLEPFDALVWERRRKLNGLELVALSQCAADLLTGTGREPSEAEALMSWMDGNQDAWRSPS